MLPHSMTFRLGPVQVAPSSGSQVILHTVSEAVLIVYDAWGGLLVQVCLVHRGETSPHLRLYGNVYRLGLTNTLHIQSRPELTLLMEEYIKSLREVYSEACVQSSWILFILDNVRYLDVYSICLLHLNDGLGLTQCCIKLSTISSKGLVYRVVSVTVAAGPSIKHEDVFTPQVTMIIARQIVNKIIYILGSAAWIAVSPLAHYC